MRILFLHGWRSVPGGVKPTYLKTHGHDVINPQLDDDDFDAAVKARSKLKSIRTRPMSKTTASMGGVDVVWGVMFMAREV